MRTARPARRSPPAGSRSASSDESSWHARSSTRRVCCCSTNRRPGLEDSEIDQLGEIILSLRSSGRVRRAPHRAPHPVRHEVQRRAQRAGARTRDRARHSGRDDAERRRARGLSRLNSGAPLPHRAGASATYLSPLRSRTPRALPARVPRPAPTRRSRPTWSSATWSAMSTMPRGLSPTSRTVEPASTQLGEELEHFVSDAGRQTERGLVGDEHFVPDAPVPARATASAARRPTGCPLAAAGVRRGAGSARRPDPAPTPSGAGP